MIHQNPRVRFGVFPQMPGSVPVVEPLPPTPREVSRVWRDLWGGGSCWLWMLFFSYRGWHENMIHTEINIQKRYLYVGTIKKAKTISKNTTQYIIYVYLYIYKRDELLPSYMGILISHEIRIWELELIRSSWFMLCHGFCLRCSVGRFLVVFQVDGYDVTRCVWIEDIS